MPSPLDTRERRLFELRFEHTHAPGHTAERIALYHGQPPSTLPQNLWVITAGRQLSSLVSLHAWESLTQREAVLGTFLAGPDAPRIGPASDRDTILRGSENWLLMDSPLAAPLVQDDFPIGGIHELRVQRALNGSVRDASAALVEGELAMMKARGAAIQGVYEIAIGPNRPLIVSILAWPDGKCRHDAWADHDRDPSTAATRDAERSLFRRRLLGPTEHYILCPVDLFGPAPLHQEDHRNG